MKRIFIRTLFGETRLEDKLALYQLNNVLKDFGRLDGRELYKFDYTTYVMGKDNCDFLTQKGIKCVKICDEPYMYEPKHLFRNKIEALDCALKEYDEVVYTDFDCCLRQEIPDNFWDRMYEKAEFQACLYRYIRHMCKFRKLKADQQLVSHGGFIYIRSKKVIEDIKTLWEIDKHMNDEVSYSRLTDKMTEGGNFISVDDYCKNFEPIYCELARNSPISEVNKKEKIPIFIHFFDKFRM